MPKGHNIDNTRLVQLVPKKQCQITQSTTTTNDHNNEAQRGWSIRCPVCYAKGAAQDCNSTCVEITAAVEEEDALRKLHVDAIPPEPNDGTRDERVMACELACPNINVPQQEIEELQQALEEQDAAIKRTRLKRLLQNLIAPHTSLGRLLERKDQSSLRSRLIELADENSGATAAGAKETRDETEQLENLLKAWTSTKLTCANGDIAAYSMVLTGRTRANTATYVVGAGDASKNAGIYLAKYMTKVDSKIMESAPILLAAYERIKDYPSSAADAGEPDRIAKHFAQRVLNHRSLELEATQCAALCLGISSAQSSEEYTFYSGWDGRRVMRQIMEDSPATFCANSDNETEEHETLDANSMGNDEDDAEETSDPDAPINLLSAQHNYNDKSGNTRLYTVNGTKCAATQGQIYTHRDEELADFNMQEFLNGYVIRQISTPDDKKWAKGHAIDVGPGRKTTRYFIREPCELGKKYLIGGRAKYRITVYKGAPMPHEPKTDEEDNYEQFAEWFLTQKKPFSITSKIKKRRSDMDAGVEGVLR